MVDVAKQQSVFDKLSASLQRRWLALAALLLGLYVLMPFAAPVLMKLGASGAADVIYRIYSTQCHQLPQRSWFLFGPQVSYSIDEVNAVRGSTTFWTLREFVGNPAMGYKVAYSDRMVSLYTSFWLGLLIFLVLRGSSRMRAMPFWLAGLLILPLAVDGLTHMVSDFWGIGQGFRDTNEWLRALTNNAFANAFYVGDAWGSFNSMMRLISGVLAGVAGAWAVLPRVDRALGVH